MVVLDKEEYIKKANHLLNQPTYKKITEDPTSKQKSRLIKLLRNIKSEGGITEDIYRKMYPTGAGAPKFYGLPKIHKKDTPLRPIVSSTGTVSYNTAKELARKLKPLVGMSSHHLQNTKDFIQQLKEVKLQQDETIISYDVKALFILCQSSQCLTSSRTGLKMTNSCSKEPPCCKSYHKLAGILLEKYLLCIPG